MKTKYNTEIGIYSILEPLDVDKLCTTTH